MSINVQAGARSLMQLGVSISDIGFLLQAARSFGNWLCVRGNDEDLFATLSEDYGVIIGRKGLVDTIIMENNWAGRLNVIHNGQIVHDNAMSRRDDDGDLGAFSWLMIVIVTALDTCLPSDDLREIIIKLFVTLLDRDDTQEVKDALSMQIQTNIESWRSAGTVRGISTAMYSAIRDCRFRITGSEAIPSMTLTERQELLEFLTWLLAGEKSYFMLVSATIYSVAAALERAKLQLSLGSIDSVLEGEIVVQYAREGVGEESLMDAVQYDSNLVISKNEDNTVPPGRVSYPSGNPEAMIQSLPCSRTARNNASKFWLRGREAASKVNLRAVARFKNTGIKYIVDQYDECTSGYDGRLMDLASEHFPVESEMMLAALENFLHSLPKDIGAWLHRAAKLDGGINDLDTSVTQDQLEAFVCFQSLVFGYWYRLLEPWVSMEYIKTEEYFFGVWGLRDTYLLVMIRTAANHLRLSVKTPSEGLSREDMLQVLAAMFAGRSKHNTGMPSKKKAILTHGMVAVLDKISIVTMSLLQITDDPQRQARFAILSLPMITVMPDRDGELWTGRAKGINFDVCPRKPQQHKRVIPQQDWSVHPRMTTVGGRPSEMVMMARCGGVPVGTFNPADADAALLRAQENLPSHLLSKEPGIGPHLSFFDLLENDFLDGVIHRPVSRGDIIWVHSFGNPVMRYVAAGFYAGLAHLVVAHPNHQDAIQAITTQKCGLIESCGFGVIID